MGKQTRMSNTVYFFKDRPLFGLDVAADSLSVMQIDSSGSQPSVVGYGSCSFDPASIREGVIVDPITIARATDDLFEHGLQGEITTRRVAMAIPASRTFSRAIKLPRLEEKDIQEAVKLEAEQYIPIPIDQLYIDYSVMRKTDTEIELFVVATPRQIADSYITLSHLLGLEPVSIETSIDAATRLFAHTDYSHVPTVLVDFGTASADITIVDENIIATGTVGGGSDNFTARISNKLGVTREEAHVIKTKYGLNFSKKQQEIAQALDPILDQLFKEIRRMIRYYKERYGDEHRISQIVLIGGSANVPGLSDRMTDVLRLPVRNSNPWHQFNFPGITPLQQDQQSRYVSAAGLALLRPEELFI